MVMENIKSKTVTRYFQVFLPAEFHKMYAIMVKKINDERECPLGKLYPTAESITGKSGRGLLNNCFNKYIAPVLVDAMMAISIE